MAGCNPPNGWDAYIAASAVAPQPLVEDSALQNIAAMAGARSADFTMCYAVACLKTRRLIYYKVNPGDCGTRNFDLNSSQLGVSAGLSVGAKVDPEPISKTILTGLATVFGGFTAAHAKAVQTEETTLCQVSANYNAAATQIEIAVQQGALSTDDASQLLSQIAGQLDPVLATIYKPCNFSCGFRIALKALVAYNTQIVFPALAPHAVAGAPPVSLQPLPVASPGAPGTYQSGQSVGQVPGAYPVPDQYPSSPSLYQGASGAIAVPFNANNAGVTNPVNLDPGTILIIGGIAFVASKL
jgi:hypothetical protein